jgi:hypothetical protein
LVFYALGEFPVGELASVEAREIPWFDFVPWSRIPLGGVSVAETASVVGW